MQILQLHIHDLSPTLQLNPKMLYCGGRLSTAHSLSCSGNQFEMIIWKQPSKDGQHQYSERLWCLNEAQLVQRGLKCVKRIFPIWPFSSELWHFHSENCFSLFKAILYKPSRWVCGKIPVDQYFVCCVWHQQVCHIQSHLIHLSSPFRSSVWTLAGFLDHVCMPKCTELLTYD